MMLWIQRLVYLLLVCNNLLVLVVSDVVVHEHAETINIAFRVVKEHAQQNQSGFEQFRELQVNVADITFNSRGECEQYIVAEFAAFNDSFVLELELQPLFSSNYKQETLTGAGGLENLFDNPSDSSSKGMCVYQGDVQTVRHSPPPPPPPPPHTHPHPPLPHISWSEAQSKVASGCCGATCKVLTHCLFCAHLRTCPDNVRLHAEIMFKPFPHMEPANSHICQCE